MKYEDCTLVLRGFLDDRSPYLDITIPLATVSSTSIIPYEGKYPLTIIATGKTLYENNFISPEHSAYGPVKQIVFDTLSAAERAKVLFAAEQARCAGAPK
jgi:hypothetical protein